MKLSISLNPNSYLPEAYAYADYLRGRGWTVQLESPDALDPNADLQLHFLGLHPFWAPSTGAALQVHEYLSLSTGRFCGLKNLVKRALNRKPAGRLFLNQRVRDDFNFGDQVPSLLRDMGVEKAMFLPKPAQPEFDLVYCGSLTRAGLDQAAHALSRLGLKIVLVGSVPDPFYAQFKGNPLVHFTGRVTREQIPAIYQRARAGLNFTPDLYPYNVQTSTKVIEYCAAGLGVVSNRYRWVADFARQRQADFLWLDELGGARHFRDFDFRPVAVDDLEWSVLLEQCGFEGFLRSLQTKVG